MAAETSMTFVCPLLKSSLKNSDIINFRLTYLTLLISFASNYDMYYTFMYTPDYKKTQLRLQLSQDIKACND